MFQTVMSLDFNVASSVSGSSDYQSVVDLTTADDEVLVINYLAKQESTVEPEASSIDVADSPCSAATPSFSDQSHSHSQASPQAAEDLAGSRILIPCSVQDDSTPTSSSEQAAKQRHAHTYSTEQCIDHKLTTSPSRLVPADQSASPQSPQSPTFSFAVTASVADDSGVDSSEDEMLQSVAQSVNRIRRPLLLDSDSDDDSSQQPNSPAVPPLPQLACSRPSHRSALVSTTPHGVQDVLAERTHIQQQPEKPAADVVVIDSDNAGAKPQKDVFELSPSSMSASDIESPDKENGASHQLAARFAGLQLIQHCTPAKPVQRARPFLSVPPKMPGSHHRQAGGATPAFRKQRESLAYEMFHDTITLSADNRLNEAVFDTRLPDDLKISWNAHLNTTAGVTYNSKITSVGEAPRFTSRVELSTKVLDNPSKLQRTLCHELCHAAAWLLDHVTKPPHGPHFKAWAAAAMKVYPHLDITTCHSYDIHYAWRWQCTNAQCLQMFRRHSNSIDVSKQVCSACRCPLQPLGRFNADGTPAKTRQPSQYSLFVKENFAVHKRQLGPGTPHKEVMQALSASWKARPDAATSPKADHVRIALFG